MQELLEYILKEMYGNPEITVTSSEEEEGNLILTIHAPQSEIGRIIGKGGKIINAIKQIIKIQAIKENKRVEINVEEIS
ncbi:MAG: KH domain-containing protein [Candidatus Levybacteria bacterium]|nr:KH domain-containing protein [Candidatus Levybacteria bacterium]